MIRLSAFADEISADLDEQIAVLIDTGIRHIDLRGVWGTNVLDLSDEQAERVKRALDAQGIGVAAIASPLGKTPIDEPIEALARRFDRAVALARRFETRYIRVFSFYPPANASQKAVNSPANASRESDNPLASASQQLDPADYRDAVVARLSAMVGRAGLADITLLHENEKDIYGDTIARCVDLHRALDDPSFRAALDPANFIQCGQTPYPDGYEALRPWLGYVHVKDARPDGAVVPAGQGVGRWRELLRRLRADGFDGVLALEPHLAASGQFQGFSGPDLFRQAARALQGLLREMDWAYA